MTDAFVPVDLDKLLDDFEQQDSFSSPVSGQRRSLVNDQGYSHSRCSTNDKNTVETPSGFANKSDFPVNGLVTKTGSKENLKDMISNTVPNLTLSDKLNHTKPAIDLLSTDVSVCNGMSVDDNFKHNREAGHTTDPGQNSSSDNLMDLTDVAVTSEPSILNKVDLLGNVGPHSDPIPPDITNGITDKKTSHGDLLRDMCPGNPNMANNLHQDLLLLDIDNPIDHSQRSNSNFSQTFLNNEAVQDCIQGPSGNLINMPSTSHIDNENSLIDLTTDNTRTEMSKVDNKDQDLLHGDDKRSDLLADTANGELRSHHDFSRESTQTEPPKQPLMDQTPVADLMGSPPGAVGSDTSSASGSLSNVHKVNEYSEAFNKNTQGAVFNVARLTEEEESLLFMQDHFGDPDMAEGNAGVVNTPVAVTNVNSTSGTNDSGRNGDVEDNTQATPTESIPVGQDAVAEDSNGPPSNSYEVLESEQSFQLGYNPPSWVPDSSVQRCMSCQAKFTVVKRRHHCRACGKIYCSSCCNLKFNLQYLEDKLARVCQTCANVLLQRQAALANQNTAVSDCDEAGMYLYLNPEHPEAPIEQAPSQEVQDVVSRAEPPPEYEETESQTFTPIEVASVAPVFAEDTGNESTPQATQFRPAACSSSSSMSSADIPVTSNIPLPPLLRKTNEGLKIDESPNHQELLYLLKKKKETVTFLLNKNLVVRVKIVKLNCCVKRKCWCFSSEGMQTADQEDMVILLECVPKESSIPQDVLSHFNTAFAYAKQGHRVTDLGYTIFGQPFLGSLRNAGFLYVKSSFQCLDNLLLPSGPHIFGILIQREEVSWVQLFPIRLLLRLGAEYRYYPSPLWSVRDREALYGDIGHTIMDLLADFKNFQYTLPRVTGMYVHLEDKKAVIQLPQNRYDEVLKVLNATDEYVMAFEASFSNVADSHLVCIQEGANYKTQCINIEGQERKVTGASFIVFNGALKTTNDVRAKVSVVEDGVMVQMIKQLSEEMRQAMREMSDFTIDTGCLDTDGASIQQVVFEWVSKRSPDMQSVLSPIDGQTLGTTSDIKINTHFDFSTPSIFRLRWTELFFLNHTGDRPARNLPAQFKQTTADIAKACTVALRPYLFTLYQLEKRRIGLRVNLSPDMVGYIIGSQGQTLPDEMATDLDNELVPAIHNAVNPSSSSTPSSMEFLFNIVEMLS